ncbi:hypothetical protein GIB67_008697 [Kingdonia uniflora]|uniref:GRAM domain-containing protein n=1 Tax=Kingdonia uniflora TaxID=39325 RepID=A0A7J7M538_9MAGN|nr:hypothetical protein GIB67_008697 [Kingdonia uniflora]
MTVASVIKDTTIEPHSITSSPLTSKQGSDTASETDPSDRNDQFDSPVVQRREIDVQSPASLKSEEYRQLFRLQWDEILVQDFNCAFQESILLQGHMYLFVHNICFYSNIFGFETKKIIPFDDVTSVRKAKTAAIFPNAIEISTGEKKHFFASFLSRDEAFRLIVEGWELHHSNNAEARIYREDSKAELRSQEDGHIVFERLKTVSQPSNDAGSVDRYLMNRGVHVSGETKLFSNGDADISLVARLPAAQENREEDAKWVVTTECVSSSGESSMWKMEDAESPKG